MGLFFRKSVRLGRYTRLNVTNRGLGISEHIGRLSLSSRGRGAFRIAKGLSFRFKL